VVTGFTIQKLLRNNLEDDVKAQKDKEEDNTYKITMANIVIAAIAIPNGIKWAVSSQQTSKHSLTDSNPLRSDATNTFWKWTASPRTTADQHKIETTLHQ